MNLLDQTNLQVNSDNEMGSLKSSLLKIHSTDCHGQSKDAVTRVSALKKRFEELQERVSDPGSQKRSEISDIRREFRM